MTSEQTVRRSFFFLLLATVVLMAIVVRPVAPALLLAAVLSGVLGPLHGKLTRISRGRRGLAAGVLVFVVVVLVLGPLVALAAFVVRESSEGLKFISDAASSESVRALLDRLPPSLAELAADGLERLKDVNQAVARQVAAHGGRAAAALVSAVAATGSVVLGLALALIALYVFLVERDALVAWLDGVSPLRPGQTRELLAEFKKVSFSVIVASVISAAAQASAALIGYFITRVPHPIFFAGVTFFFAFIPAIGAAVVCLLAAVILYLTGHPYWALILAIWGVVVVGLIDNVIKPLLIKSGMEMRGAIVFFSLIGGLQALGAIGLIVGPLVSALFLALLRIYARDFRPDAPAQQVLASPERPRSTVGVSSPATVRGGGVRSR
jgi:predicted PurR-regulated permease PerM